ncbi:MAG: hypothetical protein ABI045_04730 [Flavobacteriales bacterium]
MNAQLTEITDGTFLAYIDNSLSGGSVNQCQRYVPLGVNGCFVGRLLRLR